ncbi:MAG: glucose 1-dehydrogenase [Vicinamibacterales bacterium]
MSGRDLTGKVALVTGASSGIGAATALVLAARGARVAVGYHGNEAGATAVTDAIRGAGGDAASFRADMRQVSEIRAMAADVVNKLGSIDILINNAGSLVGRQALGELTEAFWDEVQALNLKSAVFCTQAVAPSMIDRRSGAIINVVSIAGHTGGGAGAGAYAVAKAGLTAFTKATAKELAPKGIRVNAVSPGVIATPFHERFSTSEMMRTFVGMIPMGRVGTSEECANVVAFLASDAASFIVGETIEVNGGQLMR